MTKLLLFYKFSQQRLYIIWSITQADHQDISITRESKNKYKYYIIIDLIWKKVMLKNSSSEA